MRYEINPTNPILNDIVSFDTEYTELNIRKADLLSVSIGVSPELTYIFDKDNLDTVKNLLDYAHTIFTWNMAVDWYMLNKYSIEIYKDKILDGMLMEHLINENLDHGLGDFALREYNDNYKAEFWGSYKTYQEAPKEVQYEYEQRDGCYTLIAGLKYTEALRGKEKLVDHIHKLQWALFDTEIEGIEVNYDLIRKTKMDMGARISGFLPKLREEFNDLCNAWEMEKWKDELSKRSSEKGKAGIKRPNYSFTSDKQIRWLIYDALEAPILEKTKKGSPKTDVETIKKLTEREPRLKNLAEYKEIKSVYATFVEGMLDRVENGRIYPRFNVNGTTTGRISHSNPNMGNLPTEGVYRNFFIPHEGYSILGADYSQLEVVVEANLTEDRSLLEIILEGASKHEITSEGLGITRDRAKTLNFALQYGAGVHKVSEILGVSMSSAQDVFNQYWRLYSGVKNLKDATSKSLGDSGAVTNLFGRTRHFEKPEIILKERLSRGKEWYQRSRKVFGKEEWKRRKAKEIEKIRLKQERQAYNFLIQGTGADMTNMATYILANRLRKDNLGRLWFSVHDEIVCEAKNSLIEEAKSTIIESMEVPNEFLKLKYRVSSKLYGPLQYWNKS